MVGRAQFSVRHTGTCTDDYYRRFVIARIDPDLFETTRGGERRDGVNDGTQAAQSHAGGNAHHVRLSDATVEETPRCAVFEFIEKLVANVARQQNDLRIDGAQFRDLICECISHAATPSSFFDASTSSAVGMR